MVCGNRYRNAGALIRTPLWEDRSDTADNDDAHNGNTRNNDAHWHDTRDAFSTQMP